MRKCYIPSNKDQTGVCLWGQFVVGCQQRTSAWHSVSRLMCRFHVQVLTVGWSLRDELSNEIAALNVTKYHGYIYRLHVWMSKQVSDHNDALGRVCCVGIKWLFRQCTSVLSVESKDRWCLEGLILLTFYLSLMFLLRNCSISRLSMK